MKKPDNLVVPEGMRWDHCKGRLVTIDQPHKVVIIDSGWPETHIAAQRRAGR